MYVWWVSVRSAGRRSYVLGVCVSSGGRCMYDGWVWRVGQWKTYFACLHIGCYEVLWRSAFICVFTGCRCVLYAVKHVVAYPISSAFYLNKITHFCMGISTRLSQLYYKADCCINYRYRYYSTITNLRWDFKHESTEWLMKFVPFYHCRSGTRTQSTFLHSVCYHLSTFSGE